jgi:DNA-binding beta-propeller fold protein YncE
LRSAQTPGSSRQRAASSDGTVRLWSLATHRQVGGTLAIGGHDLHAAVAFSRDGKFLATASADTSGNDHAVDLWSTATGRRVASLAIGNGNGDEPVELAFSPRGDILAAATSYGAAYLWDIPAMRRIGAPLTDDSAIMSGLAFSPDGSILATAGTDGKVTLWNVATHSPVGAPLTVDKSSGWTTVAFSPAGEILATGTSGANGQDSLWNVSTHARISALNTDCAPDSEAFSPDSGMVAIACRTETPGSGTWPDSSRSTRR